MKITERQLRRLIREELSRIDEMAHEAEPFNARELSAAATKSMNDFSTAAQEWIENVWGLGKATNNEKMMDFAEKVDQIVDDILEKRPNFMLSK